MTFSSVCRSIYTCDLLGQDVASRGPVGTGKLGLAFDVLMVIVACFLICHIGLDHN